MAAIDLPRRVRAAGATAAIALTLRTVRGPLSQRRQGNRAVRADPPPRLTIAFAYQHARRRGTARARLRPDGSAERSRPPRRSRGSVWTAISSLDEPGHLRPGQKPARWRRGRVPGLVARRRAGDRDDGHYRPFVSDAEGASAPRALLRSSRDDAADQMLLGVTGRCPGSAEPADSEAAALATRLLQGVGTRLNHSAAVAAQVDLVAHLVERGWRSAIKDAAWLHDVGYSPQLAVTGFHALDGARWLRDHDWPAETCRLVAWHTEPLEEARRYRLDSKLTAEFDRPPALAGTALSWADLTSSPQGECWEAERRLADIFRRYPAGSIVHEATCASLPALRRAVRTIEDLLVCTS